MSEIIGLSPLLDFLELVIWTGSVTGERPGSAILVAAPGAGKSSVLESLRCDSAPFCTDLTSRELSNVMREHPAATHILLSDMMAIFAHRRSVVALACAMLSNLTGDSLRNDSFSGERKEPRQLGLVTAIPTKDFATRRVQSQLQTAGFATRFMVLRYQYSIKTILDIHEFIKSDQYAKSNGNGHKKLAIPIHKAPVAIPRDLAEQVHQLSMFLKTQEDEIGTRIHHHLRALVKARARRAGRDHVIPEDVQVIQGYGSLFGPKGQIL